MTPTVGELMLLHIKIKELLEKHLAGDEESLLKVAEIMQSYNDVDSDINALKTILLVTRFFRNNKPIKSLFQQLNDLYNEKYNQLT